MHPRARTECTAATCTPNAVAPTRPAGKVRVAIIREEGSNGDREMGAAVYAAGMEPWDITMSDLLSGRASLDSFQGAPGCLRTPVGRALRGKKGSQPPPLFASALKLRGNTVQNTLATGHLSALRCA